MNFSEPFPHSVIDGFIGDDVVAQINAEWPGLWTREAGRNNCKWHTQTLPPAARQVAESVDIGALEESTGVRGLFADPGLFGAGLHCIPRGGFLNMHVDFNRHPRGWRRRVNLLIYLNQVWQEDWGGHLVLGENQQERIAPLGGRAVIFETTEASWHGHPEPLSCPQDVQRRSLALYFYTEEPPPGEAHTTIYRRGK
ncbi:MAG: 2OG-Fe(II) oxygenase [Alcanivoracaceae bacterium]|nr:2OG-Fe(II) oxygenase [Alcanivoracaceae bacterium]